MFYQLIQQLMLPNYSSSITLSYHTTEEGARKELTRQECHNRLNGYEVTERLAYGTVMRSERHGLHIFYIPCNFMD